MVKETKQTNLKWGSTSLIIRGMRTEAEYGHYYVLIRMAKKKMTDRAKCQLGCKAIRNFITANGDVNLQKVWENSVVEFTKAQHMHTLRSRNPTL